MTRKNSVWTVRDVLKRIPELGIPHFQRGLVWGVESRAALLESLFYDTPCGSFVLWVPKDCAAQGVPLDPSLSTEMKYLVIDGQQRIRSLHAVFNGREDSDEDGEEPGGSDDTESGARKVWCINLTRVPGFAEKLETPAREYSLFVRTLDPKERKARGQASPLLANLLPLDIVQTVGAWHDPVLQPYRELLKQRVKPDTTDDTEFESLYRDLRTAVLAMQDREFFVSVQHKDNPAEMADLYNRINAGGKRVEVEERAFARLVGLQPGTYGELARVFEIVHGKIEASAGKKDIERQARDQVLKRQQERAFGFKLFIRVFLQVCQHHLGFRQGKSEYSFDLANKGYFLTEFRKLSPNQLTFLWSETRRVLGHTRDVLREGLFCDDLRTLPDANSLTPVFQLLIHYPGLSESKYRPLLALLSLRLLLGEIDSKTLLGMLHKAADPGRVAFDVIPELLHVLEKATEGGKLAARIEQANSLQHRYVWLLYWLERSRGARDFLYANVPPGHGLKAPEPLVSKEVLPEKQHVLAFNKASPMYGGGVTRSGSHAVNSIGNLTYISHALNTWDGGLGEFLVDLAAEPEDNLRAHLLIDDRMGRRVLEDYGRLRERLNPDKAKATERDQGSFERMLKHRRQVIRDGFLAWIAEIEREATGRLGVGSTAEFRDLAEHHERLEPAAPAFAAVRAHNVAHVIRKLGLSHSDEDRLIELAKHTPRIPSRKDDKLDRDLWLTKKKKRVWVAARPGTVTLMFASDLAQEHRQEIVEALDFDLPDGAVPDAVALKPVPDFGELIEIMKALGPELEEMSATSTGRWEERGRFWAGFSEYLNHRSDAALQMEKPPKKGTTRFFPIGEHGMLKGKFGAARGEVAIYLRLKGPGSAELFDRLQKQRLEIERTLGAELYWQTKTEGEKYEVGLEMESAGTGDGAPVAQYGWLNQMAKRFLGVFGPRVR